MACKCCTTHKPDAIPPNNKSNERQRYFIMKRTKKSMKTEIKKMLEIMGMKARQRFGYFGIEASKKAKGLLISTLTGKLEGIHSVSTSPEKARTCEYMSKCKGSICEKCFSRRSVIPELGGYKNSLRMNLIHNYDWLNVPHEMEDFPKLNDLYFRIQSHGETDTVLQAVNLIKFVLHNPETHFTAWTKNPVV